MKKALFIAGALACSFGLAASAQPKYVIQNVDKVAKVVPYSGARCDATPANPTCPVMIKPEEKCNPKNKQQIVPDELIVRAKEKTQSLVAFQLQSGAWKFAQNGIQFSGASLKCHRLNDQRIVCENPVNNYYYAYTVNLEATSGGGKCNIDPGIFNQPIP